MAAILGVVLIVASIALAALQLRLANKQTPSQSATAPQQQAAPQQDGRRAGANRMQAGMRRRQRAAAARAEQQEQDADVGEQDDGADEIDEAADPQHPRPHVEPQARMTARSAYEERRQARDAVREAEEAAQEAEMAAAEAARVAREEAEAAKWMGQISVEEQGIAVEAHAREEDLTAEMVEYIKERKTVVLEDIAADFRMRVQEVINRVQALEQQERISGLMDDRGKFIYISAEEMQAVADFIKGRGRVAISELANRSNSFIDLSANSAQTAVFQEPDLDDLLSVPQQHSATFIA